MTNGTFLMMSFDLEILFCPQTYGLRFPTAQFPRYQSRQS